MSGQTEALATFAGEGLAHTGIGRKPWMSTMTPAELLASRRFGIRPIATLAGTCVFQIGQSWTEGYVEGWRTVLARLRAEAVAAGANAIIDVQLRSSGATTATSMDFAAIGTAVRIMDLPPSVEPSITTLSSNAFVRLLEAGIAPVGIAIGAAHEWLAPSRASVLSGDYATTQCTPYAELGRFWERVRRTAILRLCTDAQQQGNGVLAHTHFGEVLRLERRGGGRPYYDKLVFGETLGRLTSVGPPPDTMYLGRHVVLGTVVDTPRHSAVPHEIATIVDMRDGLSPLHLSAGRGSGKASYA